MERLLLLAPATLLLVAFGVAFAVYLARCLAGRPPAIEHVKHNLVLGPFLARFLGWVLGPIERALVGRVSPNAITASALLVCAVTGVAIARDQLLVATCLYVIAGMLDVLDGRLARRANHQTRAGALFDSVSDRWGELFVFAGFAWRLRDSVWLLAVMAAIGGSMMVSYTRARAEGLGVQLTGGVMQRAERIVLIIAGTWIAAACGSVGSVAPILGVTLVVCGLASIATAVNRWVVAYRELARRDAIRAAPEPITARIAPPSAAAAARARIPRPVREVAPLEQH